MPSLSNRDRKPAASITYAGISTPEKASISDPAEPVFVPTGVPPDSGEPPFFPVGAPPPAAEDTSPVPEGDPLSMAIPSGPGAMSPVSEDVPPVATDVSISREEGSLIDDGISVLTEGLNGLVRVGPDTKTVDPAGRRGLTCGPEASCLGENGIKNKSTPIGENSFGLKGGIKPYRHKSTV